VLILRIRHAETAMADGRLDEAFEMVRAEDVRAHRRGQDLIGRLVRAFVERSRRHLADGRLVQAMADCGKADQLGGNLPEIAALRTAIGEAMTSNQRTARRQANTIATAKEHAENGRLSIGQNMLADLPADERSVREVSEEIAARRDMAAAAVRRAESALADQDWATAVGAAIEARQAHASSEQVTELISRITRSTNQQIRHAIVKGRLDTAHLLLARLLPLSDQGLDTQEHRRILDECRQAGACIAEGRPERAHDTLRRLASLLPECDWVCDALAAAERAAEGLDELRAGPLALLAPGGADMGKTVRLDWKPHEAASPNVATLPPTAGGRLPSRFVIHIDGVGSYLVLRDRVVTIGPANSSRRPDLALLVDSGSPPATIERLDDDYFLSSAAPVLVNERPTTRTLLNGGDKISLSARARLRFGLPHPASTSAVLDLTGTRLPKGDIRRVILFDKNIVVGPGPSAHIQAVRLADPVVLSIRDGRLCCGGKEQITVGERPVDRQAGIPLREQVRIGPVSFVIAEA